MEEGLSPFKLMNWYFVWWNILVPEPLLPGMRSYLAEHEEPEGAETPCDLVGPDDLHVIDYPGPCSMKRNLHDIDIGGLHIKIPSTDFSRMFKEVQSLPLRKEGGIPHYRFYSMVRCLCLTSELRDELVQEMAKQLSAAVEIADWENRQFNAAMGGSVAIRIGTEDREVRTQVLKTPKEHNVLIQAKPVIDRDIDEA